MSKNQYLYPDTPRLPYYQFPQFLLRVPISQTAKILYTVLHDRARLSQRNNWADDAGRIYTIYPIEELAAEIKRSVTQVKQGLNELIRADLLEKEHLQHGKPNRLYVRMPSDLHPSETRRSKGQDSDRNTGGKQPPKQRNKNNILNQKYSSASGTSGSFSNGMERPPESEEELRQWLAGRNGNLV